MAATVILTSAPLLLSQVPLASFVPDVSQPYSDVYQPYMALRSDYSVRRDVTFTGVVNISSERFLQLLATRFATLVVRREQGSTYRVESTNGCVYTLDSPQNLFAAILESEESGDQTRRWLDECKRQGLAPRFVVGYRTFVDSKLSRGEEMSTETRTDLHQPLSTTQGGVVGVADVEAGVGRKATQEIRTQAEVPGERIYAIAYRKIRIKTRKRDKTISLDLKTKWKPFNASRSRDSDESTYLEAEVSNTDDMEDCDDIFTVNSVSGEDSEPVRIAVMQDNSSGY